jgi:hypothetical protein
MYQFAQCIGDYTTFICSKDNDGLEDNLSNIFSKQCQAYLACINSMCMVDEQYQWFIIDNKQRLDDAESPFETSGK